jgi:enterochelin esterase-like enzyme
VGPPPARDSVLRSLAPLCASDAQWRALGRSGARVYFDAGALDLSFLDEMRLRRRLTGLGVAHEAHEYVGWHNWPFWRLRLPQALRAVVR